MAEYSPRDIAALAAIVFGEARGESLQGQIAVAHVVINRANRLGTSINDVVHGRAQFTAVNPSDVNRRQIEQAAAGNTETWQNAVSVARSVLSGEYPDPTNGADHYYVKDMANPPRWGRGHHAWDETVEIGAHVFGRSQGVPNPSEQFPQLNLPLASIEPTPRTTPPSPIARPLVGDPLPQRTLAAVVDGTSGYVLKDGSVDVESLRPSAQNMLSLLSNASGLPQLTITSGARSPEEQAALRARGLNAPANSRHVVGQDAIDVRGRDLTDAEKTRALDVAIAGGARGIGFYNTGGRHIHFDTRDQFRSWGDVPDWARQSRMFQRLQAGENPRVSTMVPSPIARPSNLQSAPQSTFPARPSTPSALPAAPQRTETTPRLSERYAGSDSGSPVLPSSFPARPSMGTGGLPAARNDINGMRAQSEAIQRQTARPSVPTPRISRPAAPQPRATRSPTDFQYATRAPTPPPVPRTSSPINAPQLGSQRGFFSSMAGADYTKPETPSVPDPVARPNLARAPSVPNPVPRPTVPPNPVARPSTLPQFGSVPNPVPRPNVPQFAGVPAPMPRSRFRQVPSPVAAPRRQQAPLLDLAGFNDFMGGIGRSIGSALSPMVTMTPAMRNAPTRYAGDVVLPPQPAGHPKRLTPPNRAGVPNDDSNFVRNLFTRQPTNPSLNGRAQGPWNSTGGEGGFVW